MNWKSKKGGIYQSTIGMLIVMSIYELVWTLFYGARSVIGTEMFNEAMDYCEWKNGYRTEAMTSVAKDIVQKVSAKFSSLISTGLKKLVKYDQTAYVSGREQTDNVKFYMFAMFTIVPAITGSLGIFPMLFYDLEGKKKEVMYAELLARRAELQKAADSGDTEALAKAAKAQLEKV
jgi:Na+/melibiose symporter-like transporter